MPGALPLIGAPARRHCPALLAALCLTQATRRASTSSSLGPPCSTVSGTVPAAETPSTTTAATSSSPTDTSIASTSPPSVAELANATFLTFKSSVSARTVGNNALRRYIESTSPAQIALVEAAIAGSRAAGLYVDAKTNEVYLEKLVDAGKVKASLELYQNMKQARITPTANSYNILMRLCVEREMPSSAEQLYDDMVSRGRSPTPQSYELMLTALSMENPPKWEKAIELFDKISGSKSKVSTSAYNALMRVYLNMTPFDWRIVYNCYYELRQLHPTVPLSWESYSLVRTAFKKGRAGYVRQLLTFADAWFVMTHIRTPQFWIGASVVIAGIMVLKSIIGYAVLATGSVLYLGDALRDAALG